MRVARFTHEGRTRLGLVNRAGTVVADVGTADRTLPSDVGVLLTDGGVDNLSALEGAPEVPIADVRLEAPIPMPPTFLAIGLNYAKHVAETGRELPGVPVVFNKQITCVNGPFDAIKIPDAAPEMVDYEGELAVVIGRRCRGVRAEDAPSVVAGYLIANDVSVRDWQRASATMTMGKSWDTHGPIGPWLVTADELTDPHDLRIRTYVDGELRQDGSTADMIHDCWQLIEHISTVCTLLPGSIISTGTPAGVGMATEPPRFLHPGQVVRIEIDGIGAIENRVVGSS